MKQEKGEFVFQVNTPTRIYYLQANSEQNMRYWVDGLCNVMKVIIYILIYIFLFIYLFYFIFFYIFFYFIIIILLLFYFYFIFIYFFSALKNLERGTRLSRRHRRLWWHRRADESQRLRPKFWRQRTKRSNWP